MPELSPQTHPSSRPVHSRPVHNRTPQPGSARHVISFPPSGDGSGTGGDNRWRPVAVSAGGARRVPWLSVLLPEKGGSGGGRQWQGQADGVKEVVGMASVARLDGGRRRQAQVDGAGGGRRDGEGGLVAAAIASAAKTPFLEGQRAGEYSIRQFDGPVARRCSCPPSPRSR
jgi:hypothetical protein